MAKITVRTNDELLDAAKKKYDEIYPEGELKNDLIELVERTNSTGKQLLNCGATIGLLAISGPLSIIAAPIGLLGGIKTLKNLKLSNYMIRSTSKDVIYFERKK